MKKQHLIMNKHGTGIRGYYKHELQRFFNTE